MAAAEKTYSFRAPADFGDRLAAARSTWVDLAARGPDVARWLDREAASSSPRANQATFLRLLAEALVRATERVAEGLQLAERERETQARIGPDPEAVEWAQAGIELLADAYRRDGGGLNTAVCGGPTYRGSATSRRSFRLHSAVERGPFGSGRGAHHA